MLELSAFAAQRHHFAVFKYAVHVSQDHREVRRIGPQATTESAAICSLHLQAAIGNKHETTFDLAGCDGKHTRAELASE